MVPDLGTQGGPAIPDPMDSFGGGAFSGGFGGFEGPVSAGDSGETGDIKTSFGGNDFNYKSGASGSQSMIMPLIVGGVALVAVFLMGRK